MEMFRINPTFDGTPKTRYGLQEQQGQYGHAFTANNGSCYLNAAFVTDNTLYRIFLYLPQ